MKKLMIGVVFLSIALLSCVRVEKVRSESPAPVSVDDLWQQVRDIKQAMGRSERMFVIDPSKTALVVVDMQEGFCAAGACIEVPAARAIVPNINRLAKSCRQASIPVIWLRFQVRKDLRNAGHWEKLIPRSPSGAGDPQEKLAEGEAETEIYGEMDFQPGDIVVDKCRYSAFTPGSSNLELILRQMNRDTLLFTGTATDVCVGQSATTVQNLLLFCFERYN